MTAKLIEIYNTDGTKDVVSTSIALRRAADCYEKLACAQGEKHAHALRTAATHYRSEADRLEPEMDIAERVGLGKF